MSTYATFTEHNEWEGETWRFYIPIEGNEEAVGRLSDALTSGIKPVQPARYRLSLDPITEDEVDRRVREQGEPGYYYRHNKLSGRLNLPDDLEHAIVDVDAAVLYKGGIKDLMEESAAVLPTEESST